MLADPLFDPDLFARYLDCRVIVTHLDRPYAAQGYQVIKASVFHLTQQPSGPPSRSTAKVKVWKKVILCLTELVYGFPMFRHLTY